MKKKKKLTTTELLKLEQLHHDNVADFYNTRRNSDFIWEVPEELFIFKKNYIKKGDTIVDMGCGPSTSISKLLSKELLMNIEYTGVDISTEMIIHAKRNIIGGKFVCADMSNTGLSENFADIVISLGGLHHSINKMRTIKHWIKLLKPGGLIILREPTIDAFVKGEGESPLEEGIQVEAVTRYIEENNFTLLSKIYFNSNAFHFFNKLLIKLNLGSWQKVRYLWYPVVLLDAFVANRFIQFKFFRGLAIVLVFKKNE